MTKVGNGSSGAREKSRKRPFRPGAVRLSLNLFKQFICSIPSASSIAKVGHGRAPDRSRGAREKNCIRSLRPGEDFASIGIPELEQILKHKTFTRSEAQHLIALVHSKTMEESSNPLLRVEASTTSGSLKKHKHGDERDNFHVSIVNSSVRQYSNLIKSNATQHQTTMESLPNVLLSNIFIRLLAKQLAQMRSVSKSWNALLSESSFIRSHLNRSIHNKDEILLVFNMPHENYEPFTTHSCRSPDLELTNFIKLPLSPLPGYKGIKVIGSVNGLICSSYFNDFIIQIWNPSLSAVLTLPPHSMPSRNCDWMKISFRFGYDPKSDDYKVLKIKGITGSTEFTIECWLEVEIYSMRKGFWKLIPERFPSHITWSSSGCIVSVDGHDGRLHWLGGYRKGEMSGTTIVGFDLGLETFYEIPMPDITLITLYHSPVDFLGVLGGKLCVMSSDDNLRFELWVMEEYGVAESWVKQHVFSQFACDYSYTFGCTSRYVFLLDMDSRLVLYDPIANKETIFEDFYVIEQGAEKVVEYVDSLVWVTPTEFSVIAI